MSTCGRWPTRRQESTGYVMYSLLLLLKLRGDVEHNETRTNSCIFYCGLKCCCMVWVVWNKAECWERAWWLAVITHLLPLSWDGGGDDVILLIGRTRFERGLLNAPKSLITQYKCLRGKKGHGQIFWHFSFSTPRGTETRAGSVSKQDLA